MRCNATASHSQTNPNVPHKCQKLSFPTIIFHYCRCVIVSDWVYIKHIQWILFTLENTNFCVKNILSPCCTILPGVMGKTHWVLVLNISEVIEVYGNPSGQSKVSSSTHILNRQWKASPKDLATRLSSAKCLAGKWTIKVSVKHLRAICMSSLLPSHRPTGRSLFLPDSSGGATPLCLGRQVPKFILCFKHSPTVEFGNHKII